MNLNEININANGFVSEFRKAQANLQANMAAGPRRHVRLHRRAGHRRRCRSSSRSSTACPARRPATPTKYAGADWTNATFLGYLAAMNPNPYGFMCNNAAGCATANLTNGFLGNTTFRTNAAAAGLPSNFFVANPDMLGRRQPHDQLRRHARQLGAGRSSASGCRTGCSSTPAIRGATPTCGSATGSTDRSRKSCSPARSATSSTRSRRNWLSSCRSAATGGWAATPAASSTRSSAAGRSTASRAFRPARSSISATCGSSACRRTNSGTRSTCASAPNGQLFILPDDIIENTVKAFNVSATSANGYGALGAPTGRYLAPANGPDCIETAPGYGDCGVRSLIVNGPRLVRFDIGAGKKFRIHGRRHVRVPRRDAERVQQPYFNPGAPNAPQTTAGLPLGMTNTFGTTGTGGPVGDSRHAARQLDGGLQRRQLPPDQLLGDNTSRASFSWSGGCAGRS